MLVYLLMLFFFFKDTATTEIYTLSLHDALPISHAVTVRVLRVAPLTPDTDGYGRSAEHTSELQPHSDIVCRLLLEKKKTQPVRRIFRTNLAMTIKHSRSRASS